MWVLKEQSESMSSYFSLPWFCLWLQGGHVIFIGKNISSWLLMEHLPSLTHAQNRMWGTMIRPWQGQNISPPPLELFVDLPLCVQLS